MLDAGEKVRAEALDLTGQLDLFGPLEQRLQHQAEFEPCEMCTCTIMFALAEGQMLVGRPPDIESIWIRKDRLIAIAGGKPQDHAIALKNRLAAELRVLHRDARKMRHRTRPAENLLDRRRHQGGIV